MALILGAIFYFQLHIATLWLSVIIDTSLLDKQNELVSVSMRNNAGVFRTRL